MKKSTQQPRKSGTWSEQDDAFFGSSNPSSSKGKETRNNTKNNGTKTNISIPATIKQGEKKKALSNFSFGKQKEKMSALAEKASSKVSTLMKSNPYPGQRSERGEYGKSQSWQNYNDKKGGQLCPTVPLTENKSKGGTFDKINVPPSTTLNGRKVVRTIKNAVIASVPLKCVYCNAIPLAYTYPQFWGSRQRVCISHDLSLIPKCLACHKYQPKKKPFHEIGTSGSLLCPSCARTGILDKVAARNVYDHVMDFFQDCGLDMCRGRMRSIPLNMYSVAEMGQKFSKFKDSESSSDKYGVCCWVEIHSPVAAAVGLIGAATARGVNKLNKFVRDRNKRNSKSDHAEANTTDKILRKNPLGDGRFVFIKEIAVLRGLPKFFLGSVLAHEATHAWLHLNPARNEGDDGSGKNVFLGVVKRIPLLVEEGTCQLVAHLYLDRLVSSGSVPSDDLDIVEFGLYGIENHSSYEYGEGYKQAARAYKHMLQGGGTLQDFLQYVSMHKCFPPC